MKSIVIGVFFLALVGAGTASAQSEPYADPGQPSDVPPDTAQPQTAPPDLMAPVPPEQPPAPPAASPQQPQVEVQAPAEPQGQWVYTDQYGWVWMPYGDQYVYEGTVEDESPYAYVYEPSAGWVWLSAPWLWGWGPYPYFVVGPTHFGWYRGLMHAGYGWGGYRRGWAGRGGWASPYTRGGTGAYHVVPSGPGSRGGRTAYPGGYPRGGGGGYHMVPSGRPGYRGGGGGHGGHR